MWNRCGRNNVCAQLFSPLKRVCVGPSVCGGARHTILSGQTSTGKEGRVEQRVSWFGTDITLSRLTTRTKEQRRTNVTGRVSVELRKKEGRTEEEKKQSGRRQEQQANSNHHHHSTGTLVGIFVFFFTIFTGASCSMFQWCFLFFYRCKKLQSGEFLT